MREFSVSVRTMTVVGKEDNQEYCVKIENMEPSPEPEVGDTVQIIYVGEILDTSPKTFERVLKVLVIENVSEQDATAGKGTWDLIPMVMIDEVLYLDTGINNTNIRKCGDFDGEIITTVEGMPAANNQSNFGTGFGYQYGETEGTIEIYMLLN